MAILGVFTDAFVSVNGVDLSDHVRSVSINDEAAAVDVTAMGAGYVQEAKGLKTVVFEVGFLQDFSTAKVHQTLQPLHAGTTPFAVVVRPIKSTVVGPTNPNITLASAQMFGYAPLDGAIGDAAEMTVEFRNAPGGAGVTYVTA